MSEDSNQQLQQFFKDAARQQIADNGFTDKVMKALPEHPTFDVARFNRLWTLLCVLVYAVFFIVFQGWQLLAVHFEVMVRTLLVESFSINPLMLASVLFGLLFVGVGEVALNQR